MSVYASFNSQSTLVSCDRLCLLAVLRPMYISKIKNSTKPLVKSKDADNDDSAF